MEEPHFCWNKSEMTSYSDNGYDVTNYFDALKNSWPILCSYQFECCQMPHALLQLIFTKFYDFKHNYIGHVLKLKIWG